LETEEENPSKVSPNKYLEKSENPIELFPNIFSKIPSLIPYKFEIMKGILTSKDKFIKHAPFDYYREFYILNNMKIIKNGLEEKERLSSFFPIVFLSTKISDMLMSLEKGNVKPKKYQLIYYASLNVAAKYECQGFIPYLFFEKDLPEALVTIEEVKKHENYINRLYNFEYNTVYPTDILCIYQLVDGTFENKEITKLCRFLFVFLLFSSEFTDKHKNLVTLTVYYYSKIQVIKKLNWSNYLQFLTGIEKKTIIENIKQLLVVIKKYYKVYNYLNNTYYNII
jgi:hypothetical protein